MAKNEIHARISPQLMEALRHICSEKNCNLSDVTRAALVLYVDAYECPILFKQHNLFKSDDSLEIGLIGTSLETTRATPDLLDKLIELKPENEIFDLPKKNDSIIQLIEQEFEVFFARCRDEYDPEDGELYWFWFESKNESSWRFDPDSFNNQCPVRRFDSREEAIRDCLRERLLNSVDSNSLIEAVLPSLNSSSELTDEDLIDW